MPETKAERKPFVGSYFNSLFATPERPPCLGCPPPAATAPDALEHPGGSLPLATTRIALATAVSAPARTLAVIDQDTDRGSTPTPEYKQASREGIRLKRVLTQPGERVDALPAIDRLDRHQDAHLGRDLDHARSHNAGSVRRDPVRGAFPLDAQLARGPSNSMTHSVRPGPAGVPSGATNSKNSAGRWTRAGRVWRMPPCASACHTPGAESWRCGRPMLPRHLRSCRPQSLRYRQAPAVRTPPALEASANPLHSSWNLRLCLGGHRRSSVPCRDWTDVTNYGRPRHAGLTESSQCSVPASAGIGQMTALRCLLLDSNHFSTWPEAVGQLLWAEEAGTEVERTNPGWSRHWRLHELTELDLSKNHLETLCPEVASLSARSSESQPEPVH